MQTDQYSLLIQSGSFGGVPAKLTSIEGDPDVPVLEVTGEHVQRGFLALVRGNPLKINHTQFCMLIVLVKAAFALQGRYIYLNELAYLDRDEWELRQVICRLRRELQCHALIENNGHGGYRLSVGPESIHIRPSLWELPPHVLEQATLEKLQHDYKKFLD